MLLKAVTTALSERRRRVMASHSLIVAWPVPPGFNSNVEAQLAFLTMRGACPPPAPGRHRAPQRQPRRVGQLHRYAADGSIGEQTLDRHYRDDSIVLVEDVPEVAHRLHGLRRPHLGAVRWEHAV
jgi:hypothetical protein